MRVNERMKKLLSVVLCLCMLVQNAPVVAFAATEDNLCDHHTKHTAECGYSEGSAGSACTHEHSEDCYEIVECLHTCGDECGDPCSTHTCTVDNGCITRLQDCRHTHGDCGYVAAVEGHACHYVCPECAIAPVSDELGDEAPVCDCGTNDEAVHATNCAVYVKPDNPQCSCTEKCTGVNIWCHVCGDDYTACTFTEEKGAKQEISYIQRSWAGSAVVSTTAVVTEYQEVTADTTAMSDDMSGGWYVVNDEVTIGTASSPVNVTVTGEVHLILCDDASLSIKGSINVNNGNTLHIHGQAEDTGKLMVVSSGGNSSHRRW